jgi:hypothetical protein
MSWVLFANCHAPTGKPAELERRRMRTIELLCVLLPSTSWQSASGSTLYGDGSERSGPNPRLRERPALGRPSKRDRWRGRSWPVPRPRANPRGFGPANGGSYVPDFKVACHPHYVGSLLRAGDAPARPACVLSVAWSPRCQHPARPLDRFPWSARRMGMACAEWRRSEALPGRCSRALQPKRRQGRRG